MRIATFCHFGTMNAVNPFAAPYQVWCLFHPLVQCKCYSRRTIMLQLAIACLVIALIAAVLGFGGIAGSFVGVAKILFVVFLVLALLSFMGGSFGRGQRVA